MHLTVYHALGPIPGLVPISERTTVIVPALHTRFMLMTVGGEVAIPGVKPTDHKIGVRVQKGTPSMAAINEFRDRLIRCESEEVLGGRAPSTRNRSAFGVPNFQPHMTVLEPGNGAPGHLWEIGKRFRQMIDRLTFDRFVIDVVEEESRLQNWQADLLRKWRIRA
jgi:hypothetical protein